MLSQVNISRGISTWECFILFNRLYLEGYDVYLSFTGDVNFDYVEKVLYYFFNINVFILIGG